jgi:hypothetical protein
LAAFSGPAKDGQERLLHDVFGCNAGARQPAHPTFGEVLQLVQIRLSQLI